MKTESPAATDVHQLITNIADHNRASDSEQLWRLLATRDVFAPAREPVAPGDAIQLPIATLPNGMKFTPFFLELSDPRLGRHSVALSAADAFRRMLAIPSADGLLLQSRAQAWVAVNREQVERVLRDFLA